MSKVHPSSSSASPFQVSGVGVTLQLVGNNAFALANPFTMDQFANQEILTDPPAAGIIRVDTLNSLMINPSCITAPELDVEALAPLGVDQLDNPVKATMTTVGIATIRRSRISRIFMVGAPPIT